MSYLVLARKYRPRTFAEVVGQQTAMSTLEGAIREQRIGHAYLFCGPRGTGKTTTARILAKALMCLRGPTAEPCLECEHCRDVESGSHIDLVEMDAASNRGIEEARDLRERVAFAPMRARFKVYIVDEVHQLTSHAFNALLKTLEEPPAHVKFLFATTEPEKVIETIRSRCQIVRLSLIPEARIAAHLDQVLGSEGVQPEAGVTTELARLARGSLRDGLSVTDQLLALVGNRPTLQDVARVAPQGGAEQVETILAHVERGDRAGLLSALPKTEGGEEELCSSLLDHVRLALVCHWCPADAALFEPDADARARLAERAKRVGADKLQLWMEDLLHARERMQLLPQQARVVLEVALLDLCRGESAMALTEIETRLAALEQRLGSTGAQPARPSVAPPPPSAAPARSPAPDATRDAARRGEIVAPAPPRVPLPRAEPGPARAARTGAGPAKSTLSTWDQLLEELAAASGELARTLQRRAHLADVAAESVTIQLARANEAERRLIADPASVAHCERALSRILARPIRVRLDDPADRQPGSKDEFTRNVAELFSGQIEDSDR